jgi:hypothetical protein
LKLKRLISIGLTVPFSVTSALIVGMATPSADIGLNPVTIDCGDGAPIHANLNLTELAKVQGAAQAMLADPSDPSPCSLAQGSQPEPSETHPFVFGGGTYGSVINCELRFRIKASVDATGEAHGFQFAKAPPDNCVGTPGDGELKATVTCVAVLGNVGEMRGIVTESTGPLFSGYLKIKPGDVLISQAEENAPPIADQIFQFQGAPDSQNACVAEIDNVQKFPLDSGDVEVRG